jgi:ribonucleoside-diphosphate reductase alpha chain
MGKLIRIEAAPSEDVYDIEVADNHNFFAGGVLVHNCMPNYSLCCLASINLTKFVRNPFEKDRYFDFEEMRKYITTGIRFLDNVLDVTSYPLPKIEELSKKWRRIGLGFTGLGDTFAMLGMAYGDDESKKFSTELALEFQLASYKSSIDLAEEKGSFPELDIEKFIEGAFIQKTLPFSYIQAIKEKGIRNIACLTIAPTGTISFTLGQNCSSGIEPIFSREYERRIRVGSGDETRTEKVYDYAYLKYKAWVESKGIERTEEHKKWFTTSLEVDPVDGIDIQAIFQDRWDHSISKTANLPMGYPFEKYKELWMYAYKKGLKGFTTFNPEGSVKPILMHSPEDKVEFVAAIERHEAPKRPKDLECEIHTASIKGQKFLIVVGLLDGSIYETFVTEFQEEWKEPLSHSSKGIIRKIGRGDYDIILQNGEDTILVKGITKNFNHEYEGPTRLLSTALRHGTPLPFIVEQLGKTSSFGSWSKSLATVLKKYIKEGEKVKSSMTCPSCNSDNLIYKEGCLTCADCGYSKCG